MNLIYCKKENIEEMIDFRIKYFKDFYENFSVEEENELRNNLKEYFINHLNKDCIIVLIKDENKIVSSAILNIFKKAPNKRIPNGLYGEIYGVYTLKQKRRKGYATLLINELIDYSKKNDLSFIDIDASNEGKGVYRNCGFIEVDSGYLEMKYFFN